MSAQPPGGKRALLVVLSGPSGVGKDAVLDRMKARGSPYFFAVTATTRPMRQGEREGEPYHFVARAEFERMIAQGELLEWAEVYGNLYGVPRAQVERALAAGRDVLVKVDVQGAMTIRGLALGAILVFLAPPSTEELARRLTARATESDDALRLRLREAAAEMEMAAQFDHVVTNERGRLDEAARQIEALTETERERRATTHTQCHSERRRRI